MCLSYNWFWIDPVTRRSWDLSCEKALSAIPEEPKLIILTTRAVSESNIATDMVPLTIQILIVFLMDIILHSSHISHLIRAAKWLISQNSCIFYPNRCIGFPSLAQFFDRDYFFEILVSAYIVKFRVQSFVLVALSIFELYLSRSDYCSILKYKTKAGLKFSHLLA